MIKILNLSHFFRNNIVLVKRFGGGSVDQVCIVMRLQGKKTFLFCILVDQRRESTKGVVKFSFIFLYFPIALSAAQCEMNFFFLIV